MNSLKNPKKKPAVVIGRLFFICAYFICVLLFSVSSGQQLTQETKSLCNQTMLNIFNDIIEAKKKYPELKDFDKQTLKLNSLGVYSIIYQHQGFSAPYEFGLTLISMDSASPYAAKPNAFSYSFPLLGVKFIGYQIFNGQSGLFDIQNPLQKYGQFLWDEQQKYMPLQLILQPMQPFFHIGESIEFTVTLRNVSKRILQVKDLNDQTLYFIYNNQAWGAKEINPQVSSNLQKIILKAGDSISKTFRSEGFQTPLEFEIYCSYGLAFQGVRPSSSLKIRIVT